MLLNVFGFILDPDPDQNYTNLNQKEIVQKFYIILSISFIACLQKRTVLLYNYHNHNEGLNRNDDKEKSTNIISAWSASKKLSKFPTQKKENIAHFWIYL